MTMDVERMLVSIASKKAKDREVVRAIAQAAAQGDLVAFAP
jgi:hypothetical protein